MFVRLGAVESQDGMKRELRDVIIDRRARGVEGVT